jgi:hypothetical protein
MWHMQMLQGDADEVVSAILASLERSLAYRVSRPINELHVQVNLYIDVHTHTHIYIYALSTCVSAFSVCLHVIRNAYMARCRTDFTLDEPASASHLNLPL